MVESARQSQEPQNPEELYRYLLDRVTHMETRNLELREQIRQIESDKRYIDDKRGTPQLFDLALEFPDLAFVPYLLGLDIALVRFDLADLLAQFQVAGLHVGDPVQETAVELLGVLWFLGLAGAFHHFMCLK